LVGAQEARDRLDVELLARVHAVQQRARLVRVHVGLS